MCQECPVSLEKLSFFFIQVKIIQVLVFDNWHPLKSIFKIYIIALIVMQDTKLFTWKIIHQKFALQHVDSIKYLQFD